MGTFISCGISSGSGKKDIQTKMHSRIKAVFSEENYVPPTAI